MQTERQEIAEAKVVFIPAEHLGVLEPQFLAGLASLSIQRQRKREFGRFTRILRDLKFIPLAKGEEIRGISYGFNALGERGLFVTFYPGVRADVVIPPAPYNQFQLPTTRSLECDKGCRSWEETRKGCTTTCRRLDYPNQCGTELQGGFRCGRSKGHSGECLP